MNIFATMTSVRRREISLSLSLSLFTPALPTCQLGCCCCSSSGSFCRYNINPLRYCCCCSVSVYMYTTDVNRVLRTHEYRGSSRDLWMGLGLRLFMNFANDERELRALRLRRGRTCCMVHQYIKRVEKSLFFLYISLLLNSNLSKVILHIFHRVWSFRSYV